MTTHTRRERRLSLAGLLIACGLVVQTFTAIFVHPLAFVAFALVACPLVLSGMALFLWSLVASEQ